MKPSLETLHSLCPSLDKELIANHLDRLGENYFNTFTTEDICNHVEALSQLSPENPVHMFIEHGGDDQVTCTIVAFDYLSLFSLITGIFTGTGLVILSGDAFTYTPPPPFTHQRDRRTNWKKLELLRRRYIIDRFIAIPSDDSVDLSNREPALNERLHTVMSLLEKGRGKDTSQARYAVNKMVANRLHDLQTEYLPTLYPVDLKISNDTGPYTTLRVTAQDTPAFLYALSNVFSLWGISIEHVRIRTIHGMVEDEIDILDSRGNKVIDQEKLNQIKLSVLLTKQFTLFLPKAPDPYAALSRFGHLSLDIASQPEPGQWLQRFSDPKTLQDLAKILGASDFIWEDFVRSQYEALVPILDSQAEGEHISLSREAMEQRADESLKGSRDYEQKRESLNSWKDREIFLIDLYHILHSSVNVRALAEPLTQLAEVVVKKATGIVYKNLEQKFGVPRTVGGLRAEFAVFGLGKLGGVALGYASDIELLFIYSDNGKTDGERSIENSEFFEHLADETAKFIIAKREGIFHVDLRLRPYGDSGPKASSLESFIRYYGFPGEAHSYERLALTRLRAIAGDTKLGQQVERLRDEFVYTPHSIEMAELRELRERQFEVKGKGARYNAKFSPGALVDLEYYVQILQVMHGTRSPKLRTPRIHQALVALSDAGILETDESKQLTDAYYFLRRLINGLRMLRGNALDLFLPPSDSDEYVHLARRMGYERDQELDAGQKLFLDFEINTAIIRSFIKRHFGRESVPDPEHGTIVDLVLSPDALPALQNVVLTKAGLGNTTRGFINLRKLAGKGIQKDTFARLAVLAFDILRRVPDPDMALNNWERFVSSLPDATAHYTNLLSQPRRIEMLLQILSGSQFLADTLVRNPEFLDWVTSPEILRGTRDRARLEIDLRDFTSESAAYESWQNSLRRFRRREILRIGTRDICLGVPIENIMSDLSALADTITGAALEKVWQDVDSGSLPDVAGDTTERFCILALGKLGGSELNYSSDIDLLAIYDDAECGIPAHQMRDLFTKVMDKLRAYLSVHTEEGYVYRVDLRLRPHGRSGELVQSRSSIARYYEGYAALWEIQAVLKARPIAGAFHIGYGFIEDIKPFVMKKRERESVISSIRTMRIKALQSKPQEARTDVKTGLGGIRDVEFLVQGLQLLHLPDYPELLTGNTLSAITLLEKIGILPLDVASGVKEDYLFLRRVEHYLQLLEDRRVHSIPQDQAQLTALSKRALGEDTSSSEFMSRLQAAQDRIHTIYSDYLV